MPQSRAPRPAALLTISATMPGKMTSREKAYPQRRRPMISQLRPASDGAGLRAFNRAPPPVSGHAGNGPLQSGGHSGVNEGPRHRNGGLTRRPPATAPYDGQ